jgi:mannose-6-phosphate isomerase class I
MGSHSYRSSYLEKRTGGEIWEAAHTGGETLETAHREGETLEAFLGNPLKQVGKARNRFCRR